MALITVAGGTGAVGKQLVSRLLQKRLEVRVLTRDPKGAGAASGNKGAQLVGVNFDNPDSLKAGFAGSDQVFLSTGTSERQVRDEIAMIDAATAAGVKHLVALSVGGAGGKNSNNVLQWHTEIDAHLTSRTNITWTLIRPSIYLHTVLGVAASFVPAGAWGGTAGKGLVSLIDTRDVSAVAGTILSQGPGRHAGQIYTPTGPEAVSMPDVARLISDALGKPVQYTNRSADEQRAVYKSVGVPPLLIDVLLGLDDLTRENLFATPTATVEQLTGRTPRSVADWIEENHSKFQPALKSAWLRKPRRG